MPSVFLFYLLCAITDCPPPVSHQSTGRNGIGIRRQLELNFGASSSDGRFTRSHSNKLSDVTPPVVNTSLGQIQGHLLESRGGRVIAAFQGIPYALPPTFERRFRDPIPVGPWNGILNANKTGRDCLQMDVSRQLRVRGSEDCLYLNVYSPLSNVQLISHSSKNRTKLLPVIAFIHGGGWLSLSGNGYGPRYLLDKDVILVTFNYRLGVLGFLSTGDRNARGNFGMKDQLEALKWIGEHIANFGGDPKKITLMGESVGAGAADLHMISPLTSKAVSIHGAILLSGSSLNHWAVMNDTFLNTKVIARRMNCPTSKSDLLVDCLRRKDPYMLVGQQLHLWTIPVFSRLLFGPVIESNIDNPNAFMVQAPEVTYSKPDAIRSIPVISGVNRNEGGPFAANVDMVPFLYSAINAKQEEMTSYAMAFDRLPGVNVAETAAKVSKFYFNDKRWSYKNLDRISDVLGDRTITTGVYKFLQRHSQVAPTYGYFFTHSPSTGSSYLAQLMGMRTNEYGVSHGDELPFIFSMDQVSDDFTNQEDLIISKFFVDLCVNFASDRQPFPQNAVSENVTWSPILNPKYMELLEINGKTKKMVPFPYMERMKFWESLNLN